MRSACGLAARQRDRRAGIWRSFATEPGAACAYRISAGVRFGINTSGDAMRTRRRKDRRSDGWGWYASPRARTAIGGIRSVARKMGGTLIRLRRTVRQGARRTAKTPRPFGQNARPSQPKRCRTMRRFGVVLRRSARYRPRAIGRRSRSLNKPARGRSLLACLLACLLAAGCRLPAERWQHAAGQSPHCITHGSHTNKCCLRYDKDSCTRLSSNRYRPISPQGGTSAVPEAERS